MKNYIWDLDGTLIDSYGVIVSSLREVARLHGVEDSEEEILRGVKTEAVSAYLLHLADRTGADYDGLYREYRQISHEKDGEIGLIPEAAEVLRSLCDQGAAHFVYTHRGASTLPLLTRLGLAECFTEVVTWEAGFPPKPSGDGVRYLIEKYHLAPEETAYVGDRAIDTGCAKDAGVSAVLFRPEGTCVLPTGAEDRVITHLSDLLDERDGNHRGF